MNAIRTREAVKAFAVVVAGWLAITGIVAVFSAFVSPDQHPSTWSAFVYWLWALPVGLVLCVLGQGAAQWFLSLPFFERMPSVVRVFALVLIICAGVGVAIGATYLWKAYAL